MNIQLFIKKVYWHLFKTMPCEMILKTKWDEYREIEKKYWNHSFDIDSINVANPDVVPNLSIFVYWDKGFDNAPLIVQKCYQNLKKYIPDGWQLITLTDSDVEDYVAMPPFIKKMIVGGHIFKANYSDILRTALLYHYGGIWVDATCLIMDKIPLEVINGQFFMFSTRGLLPDTPMIYESWFIRADKQNYVLGRVLENMLFYFQNTRTPKKFYFVWFYILSALNSHDKKVKEILDAISYRYHYDAFLMSIHYGLDFLCTNRLLEQIKSRCFVQKLTYKYDKYLENNPNQTILRYILQH